MSLAHDYQADQAPNTADLAERALLGAVMIVGNLQLVPPELRVEDFAGTQHQQLYRAMLDLEADEMAVDLVTVACRMRGGDVGSAYTCALIDRVPDVTAIPSYARIVMEEAAKRRRKGWAA